MKTSYLFIISLLAGIAYAVAAYAASQTANPESRLLLPRDGDRLQPQKSRIMGAVASDSKDSLVVNVNTGCFSSDDVAGISVYMEGDSLSYVQEGRKHLFTTRGDTLSYLGYESRATRLTLDSPLPLLLRLSGGGEGFAGEWSGTVWYCLNAGSHTGVFRYSHTDGEFIMLNHETFPIYQSGGRIDSRFYIPFSDGTSYTFDETERTGVDPNGEGMPHVTAWYVSKIETPWGNIDFKYRKGYSLQIIQNHTVSTVGPTLEVDGTGIPITPNRHTVSHGTTTLTYGQTLPDSIKWNGNVITFSYENPYPGKITDRLREIKVVSSSGEIVKRIVFGNDSYRESSDHAVSPLYPGRRMLEYIDDTAEGRYSFTYNGGKMPDVYGVDAASYSDLWGFYRGVKNGVLITKKVSEKIMDFIGGDPNFRRDRKSVV